MAKDNIKIVKLSKPFMLDGQEYKELQFDFTKLTARDFFRAEREARSHGEITPNIKWGLTYQCVIAIFACLQPIKYEDIENLPSFRDVDKITALASDFLLEI